MCCVCRGCCCGWCRHISSRPVRDTIALSVWYVSVWCCWLRGRVQDRPDLCVVPPGFRSVAQLTANACLPKSHDGLNASFGAHDGGVRVSEHDRELFFPNVSLHACEAQQQPEVFTSSRPGRCVRAVVGEPGRFQAKARRQCHLIAALMDGCRSHG